MQPIRILHVMRAPVGGLFRHVHDLALEQTARGHAVGVIADRNTGGERAEAMLGELNRKLALGVTRIAMSRHAGMSDFSAVRAVAWQVSQTNANVVHGHGAKGGAYARLGGGKALKVYTPHGGSLHFSRRDPVGFAYLAVESFLLKRTNLTLFESEFAKRAFETKIGKPAGLSRVVHNGVRAEELEPVAPARDAADVLYVGELRTLKGVDVLLRALAQLPDPRATIVGDGPDRAEFEALAKELDVSARVTFPGPIPARAAFAKGKLLVVPSRAESLPYIVLEAAAASVPLLASNVGGIPEIFGPDSGALLEPGNAEALAAAISTATRGGVAAQTARLRERISEKFTVSAMTDGVLGAYADALAAKQA